MILECRLSTNFPHQILFKRLDRFSVESQKSYITSQFFTCKRKVLTSLLHGNSRTDDVHLRLNVQWSCSSLNITFRKEMKSFWKPQLSILFCTVNWLLIIQLAYFSPFSRSSLLLYLQYCPLVMERELFSNNIQFCNLTFCQFGTCVSVSIF